MAMWLPSSTSVDVLVWACATCNKGAVRWSTQSWQAQTRHKRDCRPLMFYRTSQVAAAQLCYIVAGAPLQFADPAARLVMLGADHRGTARSLTSVAAFQRTEIYEWTMAAGQRFAMHQTVLQTEIIRCCCVGSQRSRHVISALSQLR